MVKIAIIGMEFSNYETNNSFVQRGCWATKQEPLSRELQDFINLIKNGTTNGASIQDSIITLDVLWGIKTYSMLESRLVV